MTAAANDERMETGPLDPAGTAGTLILRVWLEDHADPKLRIRLVGRLNLESDDQDTMATASIDETTAYVRDWLERFAAFSQG